MTQKTFPCPHCGKDVDVADILSRHDDELKKQHAEEVEAKAQKIAADKIAAKEAELKDNAKKTANQEFAKKAAALKAQAKKEMSEEMASKDAELKEKSDQIKDLSGMRAENARLKRNLAEKDGVAKADKEEAVNKSANDARAQVRGEYDMKIKDKDAQIENLKKSAREMQRKAEQGSVQMQGEVQELAIEEWLREQFPADTIKEIPKGQRGADCIQTVCTVRGLVCGTILYESKRTKKFQPSWIEKFQEDIRKEKADVGVLVTEVLPPNTECVDNTHGFWICTFAEFKLLCRALREQLINVRRVMSAQENKGDKAAMLYQYVISNEFISQVKAIVVAFRTMQDDIEREKTAVMKLWKKREAQLHVIRENTIGICGGIQGRGVEEIGNIPHLELSADDSVD